MPHQFKQANITPIPKVDHPNEWSDYRPIALTSNLCKVFEKVLAHYIVSITQDIWKDNNQHGFLPGKCTMDAITKVIYDWDLTADQLEAILAIFFDFAKAFDLVPHDLLLAKLDLLGLPVWLVTWIAAYLLNRKQRVRLNNIETEWKSVEAGVIQGSVLGPILFILFISDINKFIPAGVPIEKYADDILSYLLGRLSTGSLPQEIVDGVQRWCVANRMRLNTSKCKVLFIPGKSNKTPPEIKLNDQVLEVVKSYKYLGVDLNDALEWDQQWGRVQSQISSYPYLVKQLKRASFKEDILITTYKSFVLSHFNYSSTVLAAVDESTKREMSAFQNRILRIIGITPERALAQYGILDIDAQIEKACFATIDRILKNPDNALTKQLTKCTRSCFSDKFKIPRIRKKNFDKNSVNKYLRKIRDSVPELYTTGSLERITRERPPIEALPTVLKPQLPCKFNCGRLFTRPKTHERTCKLNPANMAPQQ